MILFGVQNAKLNSIARPGFGLQGCRAPMARCHPFVFRPAAARRAYPVHKNMRAAIAYLATAPGFYRGFFPKKQK